MSKAREAGVDAIWMDGWCYRQQGPYNHAAFCAELAAVMRNVAAVVWLPRSRAKATPSCVRSLRSLEPESSGAIGALTGSRAAVRVADQFRLWCTFEASVVAQRRLPVLRVHRWQGHAIATSQVAMKHLGVFFFAFPGVKPPPEVRSLAYMNAILLPLSVATPIIAPFFAILVVSGTLGIILPAFSVESAYTRNGHRWCFARWRMAPRERSWECRRVSPCRGGTRRRSCTDGSSDRRSASLGRFSAQLFRRDSSTTSRSSTAAL